MGFSVLGSFGCSHVLVRNSCHGSVKFQALSGKERFGGGGDFVSFSKLKTWTGRALACNKSEFVVDFRDRTSPHEVYLDFFFMLFFKINFFFYVPINCFNTTIPSQIMRTNKF